MNPINLGESGLLVVDAQRGFTTLCPDELPVPGGVEIVPNVNELLALRWARVDAIWRKGFERDRDAYAITAQHPAFVDLLRASGVKAVVVCGLASNICCFYAARDLRRAGFRVALVEDASAGIDVPAAGLFQEKARAEGVGMGIEYVHTPAVLAAAQ